MRKILALAASLVALCAQAHAQDATGCDRFAWPVARERAWFAAPEKVVISVGETLPTIPDKAIAIKLVRARDAKFIMPPERKVRLDDWFGGAVSFPAPQRPGIYQVTMSQDVWIDVIQDSRYARSVGSTGRSDCPGIQKSVRLELNATPFVFQISGAASDSFIVAIQPSDEQPYQNR